ncbi:hypothetical protein PV392_08275 [Streptomyces sp. ME03-5709C]|nr:hypothetical protein [Streptomyces sp. ME03-5709C]
MIPAPHAPYEASYRHENGGRPYLTSKPVIAWDNDGTALVPDEKTGRLRAADSYSNFAGVAPAKVPAVGILPGGTWRAEFRDDDGGVVSNPVLAWLVHADGSCVPTVADADGYADDPTTASNFVRLFQPEEEQE